MPGCAAIGCNNRSEKGYTMKCFPRDPALRTLWTERVCRADWVPSNNSFLCNVHFDDDQWVLSQNGRIKLKRNAVPSIFTITSTRKSPSKRRKLANDRTHQGIYFVEYLDDSLDCSALITANTIFHNQFATKIGPNSISGDAMRSQKKQQEEIVVSDDNNQVVGNNGIVRNKDTAESKKTLESQVKPEMKSQVESDQDLDDIERKLRWICDGELQPEQKTKIETIPVDANNKIVSCGTSVDEKLSCSRLNGDANDKEDNTRNAISRKKRSRYEIMRNIEKNAGAENSVNGISVREEKGEKLCVEATAPRESTFTIKVTGMDEDVTEIVKSLGSEPIFQYKSTNESTRNRSGFVTSVISVVDRSVSKNCDELLKPKVEIEELSSNETKRNSNWQGNEHFKKLSVESPSDDENSTNCRQLRKKVKFQEEVIRTLTKQLVERKDLDSTIDKLNSRVGGSFFAAKRPCDDQDEKDNLLKDLSERLIQLDEVIKRLNKQLTERDRLTKKLEWQIQQRDNRIKELNWKLEKASKYLERAEKNTNTYRKKMVNMQSGLARRKIREAKKQPRDLSVVRAKEPENLPDDVKERCTNEEQNEVDENVVCGTVQDIFDESNDCDDDPSVIDTREHFLREFKGAL